MNAFFAARDEGIAQFMGMMVGEQPLDGRADGVEVGLLRFFKVDMRHDLAQHGRDGDPARDDVVAHLFLARVAFQPVVVEDAQRLQFAPAHSRVEQDEQGARCRHFGMCGAIFDECLFFLIGEGVAFFTLIAGKDDLLHRGIELIVVGGKVEDAAQKELQLLRGALFAFLHIAEEKAFTNSLSMSASALSAKAGAISWSNSRLYSRKVAGLVVFSLSASQSSANRLNSTLYCVLGFALPVEA